MSAHREIIVELDHVSIGSRRQRGVTVVENVNWRICEGDVWVVTGGQGSGKTSLLFTLAGLLPPVAGRRSLGRGKDGPPPLMNPAEIGLVFDDGGRLVAGLTVAENILLPIVHGGLSLADAQKRLAELASALGLERFLGRFPGELPRNWRARAALGRALAATPRSLLLDNPLEAVDPDHRPWWTEFLARLAEGKTGASATPTAVVVVADDYAPWSELDPRRAHLEDRRLTVYPHAEPKSYA